MGEKVQELYVFSAKAKDIFFPVLPHRSKKNFFLIKRLLYFTQLNVGKQPFNFIYKHPEVLNSTNSPTFSLYSHIHSLFRVL